MPGATPIANQEVETPAPELEDRPVTAFLEPAANEVARPTVDVRPTVASSLARTPPLQAPIRLAPGKEIPGTRYRIVRWLGEGGMGVVYEAVHMDLDRRVAIKLLRIPRDLDPDMAVAFRDEARTASRLGSEHIVEVSDFEELPDGRLLYVMEFVDGQNLAAATRDQVVAPERLIPILRQICKGLSVAHQAGVIHCDVKPENILLTRRNGRADFVRIVDFGIARIQSETDFQRFAGVGTPQYMAPEQCLGEESDGRLDIYALGCVAFELLTGQLPFPTRDVSKLLECHLGRQAPVMAEVAPDREVPELLEAIVQRCLAKRPEDRFTDMNDLEAALCEAQLALQIETPWDDLELPPVEEERRQRILAAWPGPDIGRTKARGWWLGGVAGFLLASVLALAGLGREDSKDTAPQADVVEHLVHEAQAAAARAYYVYPPAGDPEGATAYRKVLRLENLGQDPEGSERVLGVQRATDLRRDFAETLVRLGDRYWERPGGRAFATDYYAQALVFAPEHRRAHERVPLLPGELIDLRRKAAEGGFAPLEIEAARILAILAEEDEEIMLSRLGELRGELRDEGGVVSAQREGWIRSIVESSPLRTEPLEPEPVAEQSHEAEPEPDANLKKSTANPSKGSRTRSKPVTPSQAVEPKGDPKVVAELLAEAKSARRRGHDDRAERLYHRVLANDRRNASALMGLCDLYFDRSAYTKAIRFGERAVAASPRNATYRIHLGDAYYKAFRDGKAQTAYEKARALGHKDANSRLRKLKARQERSGN